MLNPGHGVVVPLDEFADAIRCRLGGNFLNDVVSCERCGKCMGCNANHALRCAFPDATRGHNRARDKILELVSIADPTASREAPELVTSFPTIRPTDIFTETAPPRRKDGLGYRNCCPGYLLCG